MSVGCIWHDRIDSAPVPVIPGFALTMVHIAMLNIIVALRLWGSLWEHPQVKIHRENDAVIQVVVTSKIKDPYLGTCI